MKLNLACGNKPNVDPEWLNIDFKVPVMELPEGCAFQEGDIRTLVNVEDGSVDEIYCSHAIEHIHRLEVEDTLTRWLEVLKEGGHLTMELPNLMFCMRFLVDMYDSAKDNPDLWDESQAQRYGMLPIFGQSEYTGDPMAHQWGYWPETMTKLLEDIGYVDVEILPAQEKKAWMKYPRDFRVEAKKAL